MFRVNFKNSLLVNSSLLAGGGLITILITFFSAPIVARIFAPAAYGSFAILNAIAVNIAVISMLGFQNSIITPKSYVEFLKLVSLCFYLMIITSISCLFVFLILDQVGFLEGEIQDLWGFIPLLICVSAILQIVNYISIRFDYFGNNSIAKITGVSLSKISNITLGITFGSKSTWLLVSEILLRISNSIILLRRKKVFSSFYCSIRLFSFQDLKETFLSKKKYFFFNLPSNWIRISLTQLPIYFLASYFSADDLGAFSMSNSLLNIPLIILGQSVATAIFRRGSLIWNTDRTQLKQLVFKAAIGIFIVSLLPFSILDQFGDHFIVYFLGSQWEKAGIFTQELAFANLSSIILYSLWSMYLVIEKESYRLYASVFHFLGLLIYFLCISVNDVNEFIQGYATINIVLQSILITHIFYVVGVSVKRIMLSLIVLVAIVLFFDFLFDSLGILFGI